MTSNLALMNFLKIATFQAIVLLSAGANIDLSSYQRASFALNDTISCITLVWSFFNNRKDTTQNIFQEEKTSV